MKVKLYKPFEHWYHGGTIWLYSDPHFDDPDCKIMNSDWPDSSEQVKLINKNLSKNDTIIFLGDIGNEEWIKQIKGYKVLLIGNHDKGSSNYKKRYRVQYKFLDKVVFYDVSSYEEAQEYAEEMKADFSMTKLPRITNNGMFDEVYEGPLFINEKICLSHEPINLGFGINIHGHSHGFNGMTHTKVTCNNYVQFNVCADATGFNKVRLDELVEGCKVKDIHRLVIDRASK